MTRSSLLLNSAMIIGFSVLNCGVVHAQRSNPALGDGGSLSSPPGAASTQNNYSGYSPGGYGGYSSWAPSGYNAPNFIPAYNGYFPNNNYGQYSRNYQYNTPYYNYSNGGYGLTPYQGAYNNGYGYGGFGNAPVNLYYGGSDPGFGNGGYDNSSYRYFQTGSPYSRF